MTEKLTFLSHKKWFLLALLLTLAAAWGLASYLNMAQTPIASVDLTPAGQPGAWRFALADGTPVEPDECGGLPLPGAADTLYCSLPLEDYGPVSASAMLAVSSRACDVAIFADAALLADPSHRFDAVAGVFPAPADRASGGGIFTLGAAKELRLAVQFVGVEPSVALLPSVTLYPEQHAYITLFLSEGAKAALPAGIFLAAALALTLLFLFRLYRGRCHADVLLLALTALAFCLQNTLSYGIYVVWFLQTPYVSYVLRLLPVLTLLWILWYHWSGRLYRFGWLLPLLCTVAVAAGILWRQIDIVSGNGFTNLLQGTLLPLAMLAALLLCAWQAIRAKGYYRRFFRLGGSLAALLALVTLCSFLRDGAWADDLHAAFRNVALLGWYEPLQLLDQFLLLLLFLTAFYDFVMDLVRRNREMQTLTLQNRYAAEHAESLRRSLNDTREMRHEIQHHIQALQALCAGGDLSRIRDYVDSLGGDFSGEPVLYSEHALVNTLVTSCARSARELGAAFEATVLVPERIGIRDTDLAVILSNMIDNAVDAIRTVPDPAERHIHLTAAVYEDTGLFLSCTNSYSGQRQRDAEGLFSSTKAEPGHGLGLSAMRRVAEAYNGILDIAAVDQRFHVKTYLNFKE